MAYPANISLHSHLIAIGRSVQFNLQRVGPIKTRQELFPDNIHFNDFGAYMAALTSNQNPPQDFPTPCKSPMETRQPIPAPEATRRMQEIDWDVVSTSAKTGVPQIR